MASQTYILPVRSLDYIDQVDSNRRTSPRRDKIFAAAPRSLGMWHMRVFWVTLDSESVELISGLSDQDFTSGIPRLYRSSRLEPTVISRRN